ncbi:putative phospholipase B-like lamina ancestor [Ceratina calcarata]|uniref:Phospholipase B-like n=1 Tax=Ceratina calcarata TaxID=156304 RepID=A0AAJ7J900_9HYME|nr:putative phospholipase B-like lamina ancestor [Ceratina calcarata]
MLKVVGASWLQTRISTYILIAVALLGVGAIIFGEFGHVEQDGTYSATVSWNRKGGYRIDFWGQGNDLSAVPFHAARAYYKTGIFEHGWSYIEIETSSKYPDTVQAYAAGLLEGSLTWQLIHHHWYNTIRPECEAKPAECQKLKHYLRDNTAIIREYAELKEANDPFWHMVRLFYMQLDGLEAGWKFAVRRSRVSVSLEHEDFLWLALASDLPGFQQVFNISEPPMSSTIFFKLLPIGNSDPLIAIGQQTTAPYTQMLRLLKKYTFGYHVSPTIKTAALTPGRSIVMSSYPGALSSRDEFYLMYGENRELVVAGTPLLVTNRSEWSFLYPKDYVMLTVKLMAANRLATGSQSWFNTMSHPNGGASAMQWISFEPRSMNVLLMEQLPKITVGTNYTEDFRKNGFISYVGLSNFQCIRDTVQPGKKDANLTKTCLTRLENVTTLEKFGSMMRGCSQEDRAQNLKISDPLQKLTERKDLDDDEAPYGVIDTKIFAIGVDGIESFEVTSGPSTMFKWSESFPNISHVGHPDTFNFESVTPKWVWI